MSICTGQTNFKFRHKHKCVTVGGNIQTPNITTVNKKINATKAISKYSSYNLTDNYLFLLSDNTNRKNLWGIDSWLDKIFNCYSSNRILTIVTKWINKRAGRKILLGSVIVLIVFSRSISERVFLGQQIAYTYLGQDAGFEELYLFDNGKCKLTYGNILGVTENHYGAFDIKDTIIYIDTKTRLLDLGAYAIKVNNKVLTIQKR